ncbi:MFS transporter [Rhodoferax ferrireducens]|uniref:MFS transporter n=1 Tax=Rhodoferax ferrireducens TaxID=192843 RepID=UPI000E0DE200|nr:MFS transporter [Rhodoferax ferrireducens]
MNAASGITTNPVPLAGNQERLLVFTLAGIQFSHILDFMIMMPLGPILIQALQIDTQQFALLVAIYTLTAAGSGLLAATFVDFFERKSLLLTLFALFALATLLCAMAPDYQTLLLTRGLAGVFGGVLSAMLQTIIGDVIPFERRGKASGSVMSAAAVASVLGVPMSLMLATKLGWQWPFVAIAVIAVVFLLLAARNIPTLPKHQAAHSGRSWKKPFASMRAVLQERNHLLAMLFMALGAFSTFTVISYLTLYLTGNVGLSAEQLPLVYALGGMAGFLSARLIGGLADHWGKVRTYRLIALLSIAPILLQTHLPPMALGWVLLCSTLFFTLGSGRAIPAMAITISAVQPPLRGAFMALNSSIQQLACGAAAFLGGLMISRTPTGVISGYGHAGWLAIGLTGFTILLAGKIHMHTRPLAA